MLTKKDIEKLVKGETNLVYKVYWLLFFYGGFRPGEALSLKWENINFEKKGIIIKVYSPKTKKTFYKTLPKHAEEYLIDWRKKNESKWLFPSPFFIRRFVILLFCFDFPPTALANSSAEKIR